MGAGVVVLREGFEASLVVGIVLAFLDRTGRRDGFAAVWVGVAAALALSLVVGIALFAAGAELEGRSEAIFEGVVMLAGCGPPDVDDLLDAEPCADAALRRSRDARRPRSMRDPPLGLGLVVFLGRRTRGRRDGALPLQLGGRLERPRLARRRDRRRRRRRRARLSLLPRLASLEPADVLHRDERAACFSSPVICSRWGCTSSRRPA